MKIKVFNDCINDILTDEKIENIFIPNSNLLKEIVMDKNINKNLFKGFKEDYQNIYGDDTSNILMKIQDMLYRIHLLVNSLLIDECDIINKTTLKESVSSYINNGCIYDAVSYDDHDYEEIRSEWLDLRETIKIS